MNWPARESKAKKVQGTIRQSYWQKQSQAGEDKWAWQVMSRCCRATGGHVRWIIKLEHFRFQLRHAHKHTHTQSSTCLNCPEAFPFGNPFSPDFAFSCIFNLYVCLGINSMIFSIFINLTWHRSSCSGSSSTSVQACQACSSQIKSGLNVSSLFVPHSHSLSGSPCVSLCFLCYLSLTFTSF